MLSTQTPRKGVEQQEAIVGLLERVRRAKMRKVLTVILEETDGQRVQRQLLAREIRATSDGGLLVHVRLERNAR